MKLTLHFTYTCSHHETLCISPVCVNPVVIKKEYYVSMLIRRFVSVRVACVKSYHVVERDATLRRQREEIRTDGSIC